MGDEKTGAAEKNEYFVKIYLQKREQVWYANHNIILRRAQGSNARLQS